MNRAWRSLAILALLAFSGCAFYTPYEVKRHWFDWNSERELNCQFEEFDHLPPKVIRVRMMRWGYNIGAAGENPMPLPRNWGGRVLGAPQMNGPRAMWNEVPADQMVPTMTTPPVPSQGLPLIPPAPPADLPDGPEEYGPQGSPSTSRGPILQPASHQTRTANRRAESRAVSNAGWMFSPP